MELSAPVAQLDSAEPSISCGSSFSDKVLQYRLKEVLFELLLILIYLVC